MKKRITLAVSAAVAALGLMALPQAAQADGAPTGSAPKAEAKVQPRAAAADGYLYLYDGYNYTGGWTRYSGNASNYGGFNDRASSLWNNGYPGSLDDVRVYLHAGYGNPSRGVHNGVALADLRQWAYDGTNWWLDNSISSHRWVNL
ncbi:peptidase inhibitor family I36 protein [Streptomyces sp. NPDC017979]|uniref:peptidase inhibitor family I36 protein n=1 Tax=Streptomyces sp. NPDC017979 TaxID=3365024 RepID=UPI0037939D44